MGNLEKCLKTAKEAGVPKDQALRLVGSGYVPLPKQWKFHAKARLADKEDGPVDIGFGGARGPGKSHGVLSQAGLDDCQRVPKLKGLFLRQTGIAAKESFDDLVDKVLSGRVEYIKTGSVLKFPNSSRILLGGFKNQNDIDKYVGIEYDFIIVEELNQLTSDKYTKLRGSLRTSKDNWRPRMYTSFNPGGIGHAFVKKRYITNASKETAFVPSTYKDNPYLNKEYIDYLEGLTGKLGEAWREGNFDLFAGKVFTELNDQVHVIKSFKLPHNTRYFGGYDWGFKHPFAFVLFGVTDDDLVYVTKYIKAIGKSPIEQAEMIKEVIGDKEIQIYAGTDLWAKRGGPTLHQQIRNALPQCVFIKAKTNRLQGLNEVRKYLAHEETETGVPAMKFFNMAKGVFDCLEDMVHDERDGMKGEDVMKIDANEDGEGGDDLYDACFPSWTLVKTSNGNQKISEIKLDDIVITSKGRRKVKRTGLTSKKKLRLLITRQGRVLFATGNHPIKSDKFVRLDTLRYGDIIEVWQKQLLTKELHLGVIHNLKDGILEFITTQAETIKNKELRHYIERFGKILMGQFQKVLIFTTKIKTHLITIFKILRYYRLKNIEKNTYDRLKSYAVILKTSDHCQSYGIKVVRDQSGIKNTILKCEKNFMLRMYLFVKSVVGCLSRFTSNLYFVVKSASQNIVGIVVLMILRLIVNGVGLALKLINTKRLGFVQDAVLVNIALPLSSNVYNLEVEKTHEYFANDILVHNCRYGLMSRAFGNPKPTSVVDRKSGEYLIQLIQEEKRKKMALSGWM